MNIYQIPLLTYFISSIVLIILFFKSFKNKKKPLFLPQISQTGMKNINIISYFIYFISFTIISAITGLFYINEIHIENKPYITKLIIILGIIGCLLNILQGYISLDMNKKLHELTAYGGIFIHLITLSIYLYYVNIKDDNSDNSDKENYQKYMEICIRFAWLSIILLFPLFMSRTYYYLNKSKSKNKKFFTTFYYSLGSLSQRGCIFFLLLALFIYGYYKVGNSNKYFISLYKDK